MTQQPDHITERYGGNASRAQYVVLGIVTALLVAATSAYFYLQNRGPRVIYALTSFDVVSDKVVAVTWQMTRPVGTEVRCVVRAQNDRRQDVGYVTVSVAAGPSVVQTSYRMNTESRATTVEVLGCSTTANVRAPQPNFAPGVPIPAQPSPGIAPSS